MAEWRSGGAFAFMNSRRHHAAHHSTYHSDHIPREQHEHGDYG
eukprot:CAMPEP_0198346268 /NCGR_PEP_ID=MMETSP1450-20131203/78631_1 /TAXON_ID=753684 ORGANISM="Madagascaria erythrocladiodes, Strain CCMP3234" /NCGR_SAMPLE_ID=MMETSP1450 /ASSEMBLY_ACC=CAM_ASM_001115 /LENGTH=42 /DNA_ID= /DNA_START= /DNA_END= /DNA_ORIENTATION=